MNKLGKILVFKENDRLDKYLTEDQKEKIIDDFYKSIKKYPVKIHDNDFKTKRRLNKKTLLGSCNKCRQRVIDFERQIG